MKTICFANQKGGVAKTSTAHALSVGLANRGYRVLMVDCDPQTNLCDYSGIDTDDYSNTLYTAFIGECKLNDAIEPVMLNLDIVIGDLRLARADLDIYIGELKNRLILSNLLDEVKEKYDYCIIDNSPHMGVLMANSLASSDGVIIPITASRFSLKGLRQLAQYIHEIATGTNPRLKIYGLLLTRFNARTVLNRDLVDSIDAMAKSIETKLFKTKIRQSIAMDESQVLQQSIFETKNIVADDYNRFIDEFLSDEVL